LVAIFLRAHHLFYAHILQLPQETLFLPNYLSEHSPLAGFVMQQHGRFLSPSGVQEIFGNTITTDKRTQSGVLIQLMVLYSEQAE